MKQAFAVIASFFTLWTHLPAQDIKGIYRQGYTAYSFSENQYRGLDFCVWENVSDSRPIRIQKTFKYEGGLHYKFPVMRLEGTYVPLQIFGILDISDSGFHVLDLALDTFFFRKLAWTIKAFDSIYHLKSSIDYKPLLKPKGKFIFANAQGKKQRSSSEFSSLTLHRVYKDSLHGYRDTTIYISDANIDSIGHSLIYLGRHDYEVRHRIKQHVKSFPKAELQRITGFMKSREGTVYVTIGLASLAIMHAIATPFYSFNYRSLAFNQKLLKTSLLASAGTLAASVLCMYIVPYKYHMTFKGSKKPKREYLIFQLQPSQDQNH